MATSRKKSLYDLYFQKERLTRALSARGDRERMERIQKAYERYADNILGMKSTERDNAKARKNRREGKEYDSIYEKSRKRKIARDTYMGLNKG